MIYGVGCDLIETERVYRACERESFLKKVYTEEELSYAKRHRIALASNFAAKEACAKALRTGFRSFSLRDIACLRNDKGAPYIELYGGAKELSLSLGIKHIHISISNTKGFAMAYAVAEY